MSGIVRFVSKKINDDIYIYYNQTFIFKLTFHFTRYPNNCKIVLINDSLCTTIHLIVLDDYDDKVN